MANSIKDFIDAREGHEWLDWGKMTIEYKIEMLADVLEELIEKGGRIDETKYNN